MKQLFAIGILFTLTSLNLRAAEGPKTNAPAAGGPIKVTAADAKKHVGSEAIVTGTIAEINRGPSVTRLNFDKPYPGNVFTAVIFSRNTNAFPEVDKLTGKKVEISGKIAEYHNRAEIVVNSTNQIKVIEKTEKEGKKD